MELPPPPAVAAKLFGYRLPLVQRYAARLAAEGTERGLIGPREVPRLWDRHLLGCAVLTDLFPRSVRVVDIGSGAGLPGLVLACRRPDLAVDLVEPMQRRTDFLLETVQLLGLTDQVRVIRGRADDPEVVSTVGGAEWVVARAVAPLSRLVPWCWPLLRPGGRLAAVKGSRAAEEVTEAAAVWRRLKTGLPRLVTCGADVLQLPTTVVVIDRLGRAA